MSEPTLPVSQPSPIQVLVEICEQNHSRWTYCEVAQVRQLLDRALERDRELQQAREQLERERKRVVIGGDIFETSRNELILHQETELEYLQRAESAEQSLSEAREEIARLKEELSHSVECMDRSCKLCNFLNKRLHPVPEKPKS